MTVRYSIATGNWLTAGTWGVVDATSYLNAEHATESQLTTVYSGTTSSAFTPGAIEISHIGVKLCARVGTTGTMSVVLQLDSDNSDVSGTEVTINVADLPSALETDANGGWIFFKLTTPVTLSAATAYQLAAKTSNATQVNLWCDGTADNLSRCLVTTTTGAPAAGDDMIVAGEKTGAGTANAFAVTMNETATTDYGAASTSLVTPAIAICDGGTLTWGTTAATAYVLKVSGNIIVYSGGTYNQGTVATACPRDSSMELHLDSASNVDFGLIARNLSTVVIQGLSRTSGKNVVTCKLNTDEAANSTSLGVDTDTGWLDNDEICIASTTRTASQSEAGTLNGNAGASSLTVDGFAGTGGGLLNAHGGTSPVVAEINLISRNVTIRGTSASLQAYIDIKATASVDCDWARFKWLGSATTSKRGIDVTTTTGSASFTYCGFDDWGVSSSNIVVTGATTDNYTFQHCTWWDTVGAIITAVTSGTTWTLDNLVAIGASGAVTVFNILDVGGTITNITAAGCPATNPGILISQAASMGTISNLTAHSNASGSQLQLLKFFSGTVTNVTFWRGAVTQGAYINELADVIIDGLTAFGNSSINITFGGNTNLVIQDAIVAGDTTFSTAVGTQGSAPLFGDVTFEDSTFGVVSGIFTAHTTGDINIQTALATRYILYNTTLASATEVINQSVSNPGVFVTSQKHDQTAGMHKTWKREGTLSSETTAGLFDVTPSLRLTPLSATEKLTSDGRRPVFFAAVANGGTLTVGVKVRESVAGDGTDYNGSRVRLLVKRNVAAGIATDTVLATATVASEGAFEIISGVTAAVTDDAILEFMVDCDGTTGWVNVDTFTCTPVADSKSLKFWLCGHPVGYGDNSSGSVGSSSILTYSGMSGGMRA